MFGSSAGEPYWHQATASSPCMTNAAWARPQRTRRSLSARLASASYVFSAAIVWKYVHQHPPKTPLCRSIKAAYAAHVSGPRASTRSSSLATRGLAVGLLVGFVPTMAPP